MSFWKLLGITSVITIHDLVFPTNLSQYLQINLQSWNPLVNLGLNDSVAITNLPTAWAFYVLNKIGLTPGQVEIVFLVGVVFIAGLSMYFLSMYFTGGKRLAALIAAFIFMFNPFVVDNMLWGQVPLQAAYALIPLALLFFIMALDRQSLDRFSIFFAALAGILLSLISCLAIQYAYVLILLFALWTIAAFCRVIIKKRNLPSVRGIAKTTVILLMTGAVAMLSRLNLIIQVLSNSLDIGQVPFQQTSLYLQNVVYFSNLIGGIQNTLRLRYRAYSFYEVFENQAINDWHIPYVLLLIATYLFVVLVFAALFVRKKNRSIIWFALIVVIFAFLSAGTNTPINVYSWLFQHVYGFFIFNEPSRFMVCVALGSSYLFGITMSAIYEFIGRVNLRLPIKCEWKLISKFNLKHKLPHLKFAKVIVVLLMFVVVWPNVFPLIQGNFGGLDETTYPKGYEDSYDWLAAQKGDFRVLVLPLSMWGNWSLPTLPLWPRAGYADLPFYNSPPQPIIVQPSSIAMSRGSHSILYYLENLLYTGQIDRFADLLSILNVKYVLVAPLSERSPLDVFSQSYEEALGYIEKSPSLLSVYSSEGYYIFENLKFRGQMYTINAPSIAFGNLNLLCDLASGTQTTLPGIVFGYDLNPTALSSVANLSNGFIIQGNHFLDYVLQSIDSQHVVSLASNIRFDLNDPNTSWVLSTAYTRPISDVYASGQFYSSSGFGFTNATNTSLNLQYDNRVGGEQQIWIRAAEGPKAGNLIVSTGSNAFPLLSLNSQQFQDFQWHLVGKISMGTSMQNLSIKSLNGTNMVDSLVIVPTDVFKATYAECINSIESKGLKIVIDPSTFNSISGFESVADEPKTLKYDSLMEANASNVVKSVASLNLTIPFASNFSLFLDAQVTVGKVGLKVYVDNSVFNTVISASTKGSNEAMKIGSINLDEGVHNISLEVNGAYEGNLTFFDLQLVESSANWSTGQITLLQPNFDSFSHATILVNSSQQSFLVYSASYDPGWYLRMDNSQKTFHVETNGFGNGWFIPRTNSTNGEQTLDLSFSSQKLLDITILANVALILAIVGVLVIILIRRRFRKIKPKWHFGNSI